MALDTLFLELTDELKVFVFFIVQALICPGLLNVDCCINFTLVHLIYLILVP